MSARQVREDVDQDYAGTEKETRHVGNTGFSFVFLMEFDTNQDQKVSKVDDVHH